jgi:hypothetical protein
MTTEPMPGTEPAPDPGPIVPSGGEETNPTIDPDVPDRDPDPDTDPATRGLATRDRDQLEVDQEMSG